MLYLRTKQIIFCFNTEIQVQHLVLVKKMDQPHRRHTMIMVQICINLTKTELHNLSKNLSMMYTFLTQYRYQNMLMQYARAAMRPNILDYIAHKMKLLNLDSTNPKLLTVQHHHLLLKWCLFVDQFFVFQCLPNSINSGSKIVLGGVRKYSVIHARLQINVI